MVDSRTDVVDVIDDAIISLNGISDALSYRVCMEDDSMLSMLLEIARSRAEELEAAAKWLKEADGIR